MSKDPHDQPLINEIFFINNCHPEPKQLHHIQSSLTTIHNPSRANNNKMLLHYWFQLQNSTRTHLNANDFKIQLHTLAFLRKHPSDGISFNPCNTNNTNLPTGGTL